jgi:hypothetical protein
MALGHRDGRRARSRAFQPTVDGRLETRVLLSTMAEVRSQTAAGGQAVVITDTNNQQFYVSVTQGTIQAYPASGGRVSLVANGTTSNTLLEINQIIPTHSSTKGAHTFNSALGGGNGILNIAAINISSGYINSIEGYHTAVLSGPLTVSGTAAVNRIALQSIYAGGSIAVGGDLDTLDILNSADFADSAGLYVGRDLNWFEAGENVSFTDGANMYVVRGTGQVFQAAKGSGNGGQGISISGNLTIGEGDFILIGDNVGPYGVAIAGSLTGASRFFIDNVPVTTSLPVTDVVTGDADSPTSALYIGLGASF